MKSFVFVRKIVIFYALLWLGINNILYKDVIINHEEIANLKDEFLPRFVEDHIILGQFNHFENQRYKHDLSEYNLDNNMHAAILDFWDSSYKDGYNKLQSQLFSRCVFSDIDQICHNLVLKLIFTVHNFGRLINDNIEEMEPLIIYSSDNCLTSLNDWQDEHYFTKTFSIFFLFKDGRHLAKCKTSISLKV